MLHESSHYYPTAAANVRQSPFNATGDGSSDDRAALQSAIDAAAAVGGGTVFVPAGVYRVTAPLRLASNVALVGTGASSVICVSKEVRCCSLGLRLGGRGADCIETSPRNLVSCLTSLPLGTAEHGHGRHSHRRSILRDSRRADPFQLRDGRAAAGQIAPAPPLTGPQLAPHFNHRCPPHA